MTIQLRDTNPSEVEDTLKHLGLVIGSNELDPVVGIVNDILPLFRELLSIDEGLPDNLPRPAAILPTLSGQSKGWACYSDIQPVFDGLLRDTRVVVKDTISVAGLPMLAGSKLMQGFVPSEDATIVTRVLENGGTIKGKSHCEDLCWSGGSHTNAFTPVVNPVCSRYSAGGSSSGSTTLVMLNEADLGLGGDQGGSVRIPAAFCGAVGMKPTWGLIPYTGTMTMERTCDHLGLITRTVEENARALSVVSGVDGLDSRQDWSIGRPVVDYHNQLAKDVSGMNIGVLLEGFSCSNAMESVNSLVMDAVECFGKLGSSIEHISIPEHSWGPSVFAGVYLEGTLDSMVKTLPDLGHKGKHMPDCVEYFTKRRSESPCDLPITGTISFIAAEILHRRLKGRAYSKARNLSLKLTQAYDEMLVNCDILVMPTVPKHADLLPGSREDGLRNWYHTAKGNNANTCPFNITGHPAISIPCGTVQSKHQDGVELPVGMMLVGKHFDEATLYAAAYAFEQSRLHTS